MFSRWSHPNQLPLLNLKVHRKIAKVTLFHFCDKVGEKASASIHKDEQQDDQQGTQYSNWVLARSAKFNHDVSYLKRRYGRDRYNIHKLTNLDFMCTLVNREDKYNLNLNQNIVLLAQMNHVCNVLKKDKGMYGEFTLLTNRIMKGIQNPDDYVCVGTFMNILVDLGDFNQHLWVLVIDALFVRKYDEQYDQLFGLYSGLYKYKQNIEEFSDYFELQRNKVIFNIPMIYRNSLEVIRQYVKYNVYNLKQCRLLFRALHNSKINQKYFWQSVSTWLNIYIKEQLQRKDYQEFFIVSESAVDKILFDDGMIRPRSVLEELSEIAFILSEHGFISDRFVSFIENLILFSIQNGSHLFVRFLEMQKVENGRKEQTKKLNEHIKTIRNSEDDALETMQTKYKTLFVNPTDINSQAIVYILMVLKRSFEGQKLQKQQENSTYDSRRSGAIDQRVLSWILVRLCKPKMKYTPDELVKIIECEYFLSTIKLDLKSFIIQKIKDVRSTVCSIQNLKEILIFLPLMEFESISYILEDFLFRAHPKDILGLTQLIEGESMSIEDYENQGEESTHLKNSIRGDQEEYLNTTKQKNKRWMPYLIKYFIKLPKAVNYHERYYSFDQNCYFLYLLLKNQEYWQKQIDFEYLGEMQKLKHSIKIASYSRGFKLQMGTYFYKLMNYIDLVAFFDGG